MESFWTMSNQHAGEGAAACSLRPEQMLNYSNDLHKDDAGMRAVAFLYAAPFPSAAIGPYIVVVINYFVAGWRIAFLQCFLHMRHSAMDISVK